MDNYNSLQICQINISTLSIRSHTALNHYNNNIKNDILAIQETLINPGDPLSTQPTFHNMESFYLMNDRGVSLSIRKSFAPQRIIELEDDDVDIIWATFNYNSKTMLVGNVYVNPNVSSSNNLKDCLLNINRATSFCEKFRIKDIIILGDFNSRSTEWGDSSRNKHGEILEEYITNNNLSVASPNAKTFVCSNGGSIIDFALLNSSTANIHISSNADEDIELFTGAPFRGHIPVIHQFRTRSSYNSNNPEEIYLDIKNNNWDYWENALSTELYNCLFPKLDDIDCPFDLWDDFKKILS